MKKNRTYKKGLLFHKVLRGSIAWLICLSMLATDFSSFATDSVLGDEAMQNGTAWEEQTDTKTDVMDTDGDASIETFTENTESTTTEEVTTEEVSTESITPVALEEENYTTIALQQLDMVGYINAFTEGNISSDKFTIIGAGEGTTLPSDWTGVSAGSLYNSDGSINESLFPDIDGYHIVSARVHDTDIKFLGTLMTLINNEVVSFTYYSADKELNRQSTLVLEENQKIILQYERDEYSITYTLGGTTDGLTLDQIYGADRPVKTTDHNLSFDVTIPRGYTGIVYVNSTYQTPTGDYGSIMLGDEPTYTRTDKGIEIAETSKPKFFSLSGHYEVDNVIRDQHVNILLYKRGDFLSSTEYFFDPSFFTTHAPESWLMNVQTKDKVKMTNINPMNNTYSYDWWFATRIPDDKTYTVKSLEINGETVTMPFYENIVGDVNVSAVTTLSDGTRITVTLVRISANDPFSFRPFKAYHRHYTMHIENATRNLTITGGDIDYLASSHNILREATGVEVEYYVLKNNGRGGVRQWEKHEQNDLIPTSASYDALYYGYYDESKPYKGNVRFRIKSGFKPSNDMYTFQRVTGDALSSGTLGGPDNEGWYYIPLNFSGYNQMTTLDIHAEPCNYAIRYLPGRPTLGVVEDMPEFDNYTPAYPYPNLDDNKGRYYKLGSSEELSATTISIASAPHNRKGDLADSEFIADSFNGWVVAKDANGTPALGTEQTPITFKEGSTALLSDLLEYAVYDPVADMYVIYLTADWQSNSFHYYLDFEWTTPGESAGELVHKKESVTRIMTTSGAQRSDEKLHFVLDSEADIIEAWLNAHPGFILSPENQYDFQIKNGEHYTIKFKQVSSKLEIKKILVDEEGTEQTSARDFTVNVTFSYPGGTVGENGESIAGTPLSSDYDGQYRYVVGAGPAQEEHFLSVVNGKGKLTLKAGETAEIEGLPDGTIYKIEEEVPEGFSVSYQNQTGTLDNNSTDLAVIINRRNVKLTVHKVVIGDLADMDKEWNFTAKLQYGTKVETKEFTLKNNESYSFDGWPSGTQYTITETNANIDGYKTVITGSDEKNGGTASGTLHDAQAVNGVTVNYTNSNHAGNLILSKVVVGNGGDAARDFIFTIKLKAASGKTLADSYSYTDTAGNKQTLSLSDAGDGEKKGTLTLKHGQSVIIEDVPTGTNYTITEEPVSGVHPEYTVSYRVNDEQNPTQGNTVSGTIPVAQDDDAENTSITFINFREVTNGLTITKTIVNANEEQPSESQKKESFDFTVSFTDNSLAEKYSYVDSSGTRHLLELSGTGNRKTGRFSLKHGEYISIEGLPSGVQYEITETDKNGYTKTVPANSKGVLGDIPVRVDFINAADTYSLTLSKQVVGTPMFPNESFTVNLELFDANGKPLTGIYQFENIEGKMQDSTEPIVLKDGDSITVSGLPDGTKYSVTEQPVGYTVGPTEDLCGTLNGSDREVTIINTVDTSSTLSITKTVEGRDNVDQGFDIQVQLMTPDKKLLTGSYPYTTTQGRSGSIENGNGTISLKAGETATISDLPYGSEYLVTELPTVGYTVHYEDGNEGILEGKQAKVNVINTAITTHNLIITKRVAGSGADKNDTFHFAVDLTIPEGAFDKEPQFSYSVPETSVTGVLENEDGTWTATPELSLKDGQRIVISGLPEGTRYSVTELDAYEQGYKDEVNNATGTIGMADTTVSFTNTRQTELTVANLVTGDGAPENDSFTYQIILTPPSGVTLENRYPFIGEDADGNIDGFITLNDGPGGTKQGTVHLLNSQNITILGLPAGTGYEVTESRKKEYATKELDTTGTVLATTAGYSKTALFINEWFSPAGLKIRKIAAGSFEANKAWTFTVEFKAPAGIELADSYTYIDMSGEHHILNLQMKNGSMEGTISLLNGEEISIIGLPVGTSYMITEQDSDPAFTEITGADSAENGVAKGTLRDEHVIASAVVTFINSMQKGNLILSKTVTGTGGNQYRSFDFTIILTPPKSYVLEDSYTYVDSLGKEQTLYLTENGRTKQGRLSLRHGDTIVLEDLPAGTTYTIMEEPVTDVTPAYTTSVVVNGEEKNTNEVSGEISATENAIIGFINHREDANSLTISKTVEGTGAEKDREFTFMITLLDENANELSDNFIYLGSKYGVIHSSDTFTLRHGESITIENLPENAHYIIKEEETESYIGLSDNFEGMIKNNVKVDFTNIRLAAPLTLTKRQFVNGVDAGRETALQPNEEVTYQLTVENTGDAPATDVVLTDIIPEGLLLVEGSISDGGSVSGGVVKWEIPTLNGKEKKIVSFTVRLPETAKNISWENTADVSYEASTVPEKTSMVRNAVSNSVKVTVQAEQDDTMNPDNQTTQENAADVDNHPAQDNTAKTGDYAEPGLWIALMLIALNCILFVRKKKNQRGE